MNRGGEVHVDMVDKRLEEYVKPKEPRRAFTGEGHKLGRCPTVCLPYYSFLLLHLSVYLVTGTESIN